MARIITPGVVLEPEALSGRRGNHILALARGRGGGLGVAVAEVSTGALQTGELPHGAALDALLTRFEVRELLLTDDAERALGASLHDAGIARTVRQVSDVPSDAGRRTAADAAVALLRAYLAEVRPGALGLLAAPQPLATATHVSLQREAIVHLELLATARHGRAEGALLGAIDRTRSAAGGRALRALLLAPLLDRDALQARHDAVHALVSAPVACAALARTLAMAADIERIVGRTCAGLVTPRELARLRDTLRELPGVIERLGDVAASGGAVARLVRIGVALAAGAAARAALERSLEEEPRNDIHDGRVIRPGRCHRLDAMAALCADGDAWAEQYQEQLRRELQLPALKVRYNRPGGWGIEISRVAADRVPSRLRRVQTLKHVERYTTAELADFEARLSRAAADRVAREGELWLELCQDLSSHAAALRAIGAALAELDVHVSWATLAQERSLVRPSFSPGCELALDGLRHPVVEAMLPPGQFVPNDLQLGQDGVRVLLLTGPNMAGKSTLMRQVALAAIMAQAGGYVAATAATLPLFDAIWTRIGAGDDISGGASTFMVEMRETASILARATARSLVLLDEVGRGTSTGDGVAIAQAVVEHLHDHTGALVLFATHYHELTELARTLRHVANAHVAVREVGDDVVFVHALRPGPTSRSHGLAVARLAGMPAALLQRARALLDCHDRAVAGPPERQLGLFEAPAAAPPTLPAAPSEPDGAARQAWIAAVAAIDVDGLSPRAALALVAELQADAHKLVHRPACAAPPARQ